MQGMSFSITQWFFIPQGNNHSNITSSFIRFNDLYPGFKLPVSNCLAKAIGIAWHNRKETIGQSAVDKVVQVSAFLPDQGTTTQDIERSIHQTSVLPWVAVLDTEIPQKSKVYNCHLVRKDYYVVSCHVVLSHIFLLWLQHIFIFLFSLSHFIIFILFYVHSYSPVPVFQVST